MDRPLAADLAKLSAAAVRYGRQGAILWALWMAGNEIVRVSAVPLPGSLVGMLLLLALLWTGVLRIEHVQDLANIGLKHLMFFFIPFAVGVTAWSGLFQASGVVLMASLIGSAVTGVIIAGLAAQWLIPSRDDARP